MLGWHRQLVAQKCDGSQQRKTLGRPKIDAELEAVVVRMARENRSWGYDRIVGALANLGYTVSDQTVGNLLKRHGIAPAPERKTTTTWKEFIRTHMDVLVATDFFTAEVWTLGGLVTYYVLFFIHLGSRKVEVAGVTPHPNEAWMIQVARNVTMEEWGFLSPGQYLIHDRDTKFCAAFQQLIDAARGAAIIPAYADRRTAGRGRGGAVSVAAAMSGDHQGRAAMQEPGTACLQVLSGACGVVSAGPCPWHRTGLRRGIGTSVRTCSISSDCNDKLVLTLGSTLGHNPLLLRQG